METILYYFRDNIVSVYYFMYAFVILFLMFAIIGYLYKQKYARQEIKLANSQDKKVVETNSIEISKTEVVIDKKNARKLAKAKMKQEKLAKKNGVVKDNNLTQVNNQNSNIPIKTSVINQPNVQAQQPVIPVVPQVNNTNLNQVASGIPEVNISVQSQVGTPNLNSTTETK